MEFEHPRKWVQEDPDKPAFIMATNGQVVTRLQLEESANRCAHMLRDLGLETGDKIARAKPFAGHVHQGLVKMVRGPWNEDYLDEAEGFPGLTLKDQVDASSNGFDYLANRPASILGRTKRRTPKTTGPATKDRKPRGRADARRMARDKDLLADFDRRQSQLAAKSRRRRRNVLDGMTPDG